MRISQKALNAWASGRNHHRLVRRAQALVQLLFRCILLNLEALNEDIRRAQDMVAA